LATLPFIKKGACLEPCEFFTEGVVRIVAGPPALEQPCERGQSPAVHILALPAPFSSYVWVPGDEHDQPNGGNPHETWNAQDRMIGGKTPCRQRHCYVSLDHKERVSRCGDGNRSTSATDDEQEKKHGR
jgi:hypothetical protein